MSESTFMGVSRVKIPWAPVIDYEKCTFCLDCDKFCPHKVYEVNLEERRLVVAHPEHCVVFCRACSKTCGPDALSFPNKTEVTELIKRLRKEGA